MRSVSGGASTPPAHQVRPTFAEVRPRRSSRKQLSQRRRRQHPQKGADAPRPRPGPRRRVDDVRSIVLGPDVQFRPHCDVADVQIGTRIPPAGRTPATGKARRSSGLGFMLWARTATKSHDLKRTLREIAETLPAGASCTPVYYRDGTRQPRQSTNRRKTCSRADFLSSGPFLVPGQRPVGLHRGLWQSHSSFVRLLVMLLRFGSPPACSAWGPSISAWFG